MKYVHEFTVEKIISSLPLLYELYTRPSLALQTLSSNWVTEGSSCPPTSGPTAIQEKAIFVSCPSHIAWHPAPWGWIALWNSWHGLHSPPPHTLLISPVFSLSFCTGATKCGSWCRGSQRSSLNLSVALGFLVC